ncbi:hypothetical protein Droror1_Dr00022628 [Drosera rotundifolia]
MVRNRILNHSTLKLEQLFAPAEPNTLEHLSSSLQFNPEIQTTSTPRLRIRKLDPWRGTSFESSSKTTATQSSTLEKSLNVSSLVSLDGNDEGFSSLEYIYRNKPRTKLLRQWEGRMELDGKSGIFLMAWSILSRMKALSQLEASRIVSWVNWWASNDLGQDIGVLGL